MNATRWCLLALPVLMAAGLTAAAPEGGPRPPDPAAGRKLYIAKGCVACHQADGRGGIRLGANPTPDWRDPVRMADTTYSDAYLRDCITNGKPKSGMVPWKKQLEPGQIEDLIAYIRTFSRAEKERPGKK